MALPSFVTPTDRPTVEWANSVVSSLRGTNAPPSNRRGNSPNVGSAPFDIQAVFYDGGWKIQIKPGFIIQDGKVSDVTVSGEPMKDYPDVSVVSGKNLYLGLKYKELTWEEDDDEGKRILVIEFDWDGETFKKWTNKLGGNFISELPERPEGEELHVLTCKAGKLQWSATNECGEDA